MVIRIPVRRALGAYQCYGVRGRRRRRSGRATLPDRADEPRRSLLVHGWGSSFERTWVATGVSGAARGRRPDGDRRRPARPRHRAEAPRPDGLRATSPLGSSTSCRPTGRSTRSASRSARCTLLRAGLPRAGAVRPPRPGRHRRRTCSSGTREAIRSASSPASGALAPETDVRGPRLPPLRRAARQRPRGAGWRCWSAQPTRSPRPDLAAVRPARCWWHSGDRDFAGPADRLVGGTAGRPPRHPAQHRPLRHPRVVRVHRRHARVPRRRPPVTVRREVDDAVRGAPRRRARRLPDRDRLRPRGGRRQPCRRATALPSQGSPAEPPAHRPRRLGRRAPPLGHRASPRPPRLLAEACWPGPLTLLLVRRPEVDATVTGGRDTIGLRVPAHPLALELLRAFDGGIAAPSANRFGRVSPTTADHVRADLGDDVDLVLDGGPCTVGVESTIVDLTVEPPVLLRPGGIPAEAIEAIIGAPGGGGRPGHEPCPRDAGLSLRAHEPPSRSWRTGPRRSPAWPSCRAAGERVELLDPGPDPNHAARHLYAWLREADARDVETLVVVPPPALGLGWAVRDRLRKAAAPARSRTERAPPRWTRYSAGPSWLRLATHRSRTASIGGATPSTPATVSMTVLAPASGAAPAGTSTRGVVQVDLEQVGRVVDQHLTHPAGHDEQRLERLGRQAPRSRTRARPAPPGAARAGGVPAPAAGAGRRSGTGAGAGTTRAMACS